MKRTRTMKRCKKSCNSDEQLAEINKLKMLCGLGIQITDGDNSNVDMKRACKCLRKISTRYDHDLFNNLKYEIINDLIKCCCVLIANSISHFKKQYFRKMSKQPIFKARQRFRELLILLIPNKSDDVIDIVINFLRDEPNCEGIVAEILKSLWSSFDLPEIIFGKILTLIENLVIENKMLRACCVANGLSKSVDDNFQKISASELTRLLLLYHLSVETGDTSNKICHLKNGFEYTLIKIFSIMKIEELKNLVPKILNLTFGTQIISELALKEFALTMKQALKRLSSCEIEDNLEPEIIEPLLNAIASDCRTKSLLACRYLTYLTDHHNNLDEFTTPKIFYELTPYKIKLPNYQNESAATIIVQYQQLIQSSLLSAIKHHCHITSNLCAIFKVICIMITNIPSASSIIMVISLLLKIQTLALDDKIALFTPVDKNHMHALVISVMTLICWITRTKSLTDYVIQVICRRFSVAPHLNPPLQKIYEYESHHILEYMPELFLDKWQIRNRLSDRYGLLENDMTSKSVTEITKCEYSGKKKMSRFSPYKLFRRKSSEALLKIEQFLPELEFELNKL